MRPKRHSITVDLSDHSLAVKEQQSKSDASTLPSSISSPKNGCKNAWEIHKFGGASLANADLYRTAGDLLLAEAAGRAGDGDGGPIPTMAIVSARKGMTDRLVQVVETAIRDFEKAKSLLDEAVQGQILVLQELAPTCEITQDIQARLLKDAQDVLSVVQSLRMIRTVPEVTMEVVTGYGEIWSAQTLYAYLHSKNAPCEWIDAREILVVKSNDSNTGLGEKGAASTGGVTPLWEESESRLNTWWNTVGRDKGFLDLDYSKSSPIIVVTGFVARTAEGVPTTLKRSGSDYSATIFAKLTEAGRVTMWKNTNGVYTADPRRVPEAFPIGSLKYDEATELAYFGAQVLHPLAMVPVIDKGIPVYVRNIFNPAFDGTVIQGRCATLQDTMSGVKDWRANKDDIPIKGITSVDKIALVTLEGASIMGGVNAVVRFMSAMANSGINVLIITQANSESSITVAVPENESEATLAALRDGFELELSRSTIGSISVVTGMAIVAIVGEHMALKSGVSSTFVSSLARANVNIALIAQGSSERQTAVVVDANDTSRALRAAHQAFTLSETTASVVVLGCTCRIGLAFCKEIREQKHVLAEDLCLALPVKVVACESKMAVCMDSFGLDTSDMDKLLLSDDSCDCDLDTLTEALASDVNPLRVIVDCTNSEMVANYYHRWIADGVNIIGPSRNVPAGDWERFRQVREAQRQNSVSWLYESSVGSAIPILSALRDLRETGDKVHLIRGCVSGTLAYVFCNVSNSTPFSQAVRQAFKKGYTENNLRDDLSGYHTAQQVVILARQMGLEVNTDDVEVESLIPEHIVTKHYAGEVQVTEEILEDIKNTVDAPMLERFKAAKAEDRVLRYKFVIDGATRNCKCSLEAVTRDDTLYRLQEDENIVSFETSRYATSPLTVKGAAAGAELAAAGIFADLLRFTRSYAKITGSIG